MRQSIIFAFFMICFSQLSVAQKIYLTYKIQTADSLFVFRENVFSDYSIQSKAYSLFMQHVPNENIVSIEDNLNRKFVKTDFDHESFYSKVLNEGHYNLYKCIINGNTRYYICSKNDTMMLNKKDSVNDHEIIQDDNYRNKLVILSKQYPDLWKQARNTRFNEADVQKFISYLNGKYATYHHAFINNDSFRFLNISLKGIAQNNLSNIVLDVLTSDYFINTSSNLSLKYGVELSYSKQTAFFPKLFSGLMFENGSTMDSIYIYKDHYETMNAKIVELPVMLNYEFTNSTVTPYCYVGLAPMLYFATISRTDSNEIRHETKFTVNAFAALGIKLKLTNACNIMAEYKCHVINQSNFLLGVEYYLKLKH
ncbi:hypothetical protein [Microbacter margulisiae]|nr:hypothetical protein [Microbacter margulisiae]